MRWSSQKCTSARIPIMSPLIRYKLSLLQIQTFLLNFKLSNPLRWAFNLFSRCYSSLKDMHSQISRNFWATLQDHGKRESPRPRVLPLIKLSKSSEWIRHRPKGSTIHSLANLPAKSTPTNFLRCRSRLAKIMMDVINMISIRHFPLHP